MAMMRLNVACLSVAALLIAAASVWADEELTEEDYARIQASLAETECEMDRADIQKQIDGFKLKNVICMDEQNRYEIQMNSSYDVVNKLKL